MLRAAGNFANLAEYERARVRGATLAPLPALLIVVDEFSELLSQHPEKTDTEEWSCLQATDTPKARVLIAAILCEFKASERREVYRQAHPGNKCR